jgi:uncharacterized protein with HEPN domain
MSQHDDDDRLGDMLDYARQAVAMVAGRQRADLDRNDQLRLAAERCIEIIGEAAGHISDRRRTELDDVPWFKIIGMRNRLVHGYGAVDRDIVWDVVTVQLPMLIRQIESTTGDENQQR